MGAFQHTAARRRLPVHIPSGYEWHGVSTHSRPKAAEATRLQTSRHCAVSTHSRPKAAEFQDAYEEANYMFQHTAARRRLRRIRRLAQACACFNTQPPEGGCKFDMYIRRLICVSTHSRPKAADIQDCILIYNQMFQHTAARRRLAFIPYQLTGDVVSTHSRPKAAVP